MPDFEKQNRWLLNLRHEGEWGTRWKTTVNYSAVSDLDYLEDIGGDVGSEAVDKFVGPVDSSLANRRSAALTRLGKVEYRDGRFAASLFVQGFQNLDPNGSEQYEKIPSLTAGYGNEIGVIDYKVDFDYSFFTKDNTDIRGINAIVGERVTSSVNFSIPYRQTLGFRQTKPECHSSKVQSRRYADQLSGQSGGNNSSIFIGQRPLFRSFLRLYREFLPANARTKALLPLCPRSVPR